MDLRVHIGGGKRGLVLANPVLTASGCFGNGIEFLRVFDIQRLGGIVSKGITLRPRLGNPQPRIVETPAGMINSIGLQNVGVDAVLRELAPIWATWSVPVIANIAAERVEDYAELARRLDEAPGVSALELNISCPNVENGLEFGSRPEPAAAVVQAVRQATGLPVIVKLTPTAGDVVAVAAAVVEAGADALTIANTFPALSIDIQRRRPALGWGSGGLSGPAIRPIVLKMVYDVARAGLGVPIIGCGGIATWQDAVEYLMAGASAVQVGTATFFNPRAPLEVLEGLQEFLRQEGIEELRELVGAAVSAGQAKKVYSGAEG
ncbi:Dihydroorotate dehydrogenase B (NAD(+)), catalytic subunit [bacterium HR24]|jgi:dihydroorotate dehydrogenase (NAD+) catalytic subunit|nr:Dihydroorotate dehydrogenase B (NAD(+)), catalytic subunit [bacterium HR24]